MASLRKREAWLKANNVTIGELAKRTGLEYFSVCRWFTKTPRTPRKIYRDRVAETFPTFPALFSAKPFKVDNDSPVA